jgi:hypothetical protein
LAQGQPSKSKTSAAKKSGAPEDATLINQVHGHWVIEVRNPDGSLTARSESENAAVTPSVLPPILGRAVTQAAWSIELTATSGLQPCPSEIIPGLHSH